LSKPTHKPGGFPLRLDQLHPAPRRAHTPAGAAVPRAAATALVPAVPPAASHPLDGQQQRARMVERLRAAGLRDDAVLAALARVPRHLFVDAGLLSQAYEDTSLPIGLSQTISKPSVVGRMIELLRQGRSAPLLGKVLEVGTGCGYQAAVLAELFRQVFSVERLKPLHDRARENLSSLRGDRVRLIFGDGMRGHPPNAPYDAIIAAACGDELPQAWLDQLAIGGRLVAPTSQGPQGGQALIVVERKTVGTFERSLHEAVHFVPLKSGVA
jgi:protein-L-isoaspartate(D-aspartate) O-methyltransferase